MAEKFDQYRRNAEEAQKWADRSTNDEDKARWLKLVEGWLGLTRVRPQSLQQTSAEQFDQAVDQQGTGQVDSQRTH
jgi:hypothetical protein